ncbi:TPA: hypothetical protein DF272_01100 [Candidatus Falkowbacteria bacterium]|nr:hypothetical protein [Candidatus Falkowbacteria bacterium]
MALNETQQLYEALKQSENALIVFRQEPSGDTLAAGLALSLFFEKLSKEHEIVCQDFEWPATYDFLPHSKNIEKELKKLRKFIISLDITETPIDNVRHEVVDNKLQIFIEPRTGIIDQKKIHTLSTDYRHDLIITLNTPELESLQDVYEKNTDFFYHTPIINIDHLPENEHYGHYNIVQVTATSVSEVVYNIIEKIDSSLIDEKIATCILTGMIEKTRSFKTASVTPRSLQIASELVARGAKRETIVKQLYQTKSVETLRLWGRVLQNLTANDRQDIVWSQITQTDFQETKTTADNLTDVVDELILNIPTVKLTVLFYHTAEGTKALVKTENGLNLIETLAEYQPLGSKNIVLITLKESQPEDIIFHLEGGLKSFGSSQK